MQIKRYRLPFPGKVILKVTITENNGVYVATATPAEKVPINPDPPKMYSEEISLSEMKSSRFTGKHLTPNIPKPKKS